LDYLKRVKDTKVPEIDWDVDKVVSWTQFSNWQQCPHRWYLIWQKRFKTPPNIHFAFGTAMHETIQEYLELMYNGSIRQADEFDLHADFQERILSEYKKDKEKLGEHFSTPEELTEFTNDGLEILDFFERWRQTYYYKTGWKLLGIEMPLLIAPSEFNPHVKLYGKLDVVMWNKEQHRIKIQDLKTSTRGWNQWAKKDPGKKNQLVLYKSWFAKQYNVPNDIVDVEYFILKRKVNPDAPYPAMRSRIQKFSPSSGKTTQNKLNKDLIRFVEENFVGKEFKEKEHEKKPSDKTCKWCPFKDKPDLCDKKNKVG